METIISDLMYDWLPSRQPVLNLMFAGTTHGITQGQNGLLNHLLQYLRNHRVQQTRASGGIEQMTFHHANRPGGDVQGAEAAHARMYVIIGHPRPGRSGHGQVHIMCPYESAVDARFTMVSLADLVVVAPGTQKINYSSPEWNLVQYAVQAIRKPVLVLHSEGARFYK